MVQYPPPKGDIDLNVHAVPRLLPSHVSHGIALDGVLIYVPRPWAQIFYAAIL